VQGVFLVHLRSLGEFFRNGVEEFRKDSSVPPARFNDDIYAVDFCHSVLWDETTFHEKTKLIRAINKTLFHMTYSRDLKSEIDVAFDASLHVHGTVRLMRNTWDKFLNSMRHEHKADLDRWLHQHTRADDAYGLRVPLADFDRHFEGQVNRLLPQWRLNQTPDGSVV